MKIIAIVGLFLAFSLTSHATVIPVDLGPTGIYLNRQYNLPITAPLDGQEMTFDLSFNNPVTILPGAYARYFVLYLVFQTNDNFSTFASYSPYYQDPTRLNPFTFNSVHYDFTFPNDPGFSVTNTTLEFFTLASNTSGFRIGPHVPESGATITLLVLSLFLLLTFKQILHTSLHR